MLGCEVLMVDDKWLHSDKCKCRPCGVEGKTMAVGDWDGRGEEDKEVVARC